MIIIMTTVMVAVMNTVMNIDKALLFVEVVKFENAYLFHFWFSMRGKVDFTNCPN